MKKIKCPIAASKQWFFFCNNYKKMHNMTKISQISQIMHKNMYNYISFLYIILLLLFSYRSQGIDFCVLSLQIMVIILEIVTQKSVRA